LNWDQIEQYLGDLTKDYEIVSKQAIEVNCSASDPFSIIKTKILNIQKDLNELSQIRSKTFCSWMTLADSYGTDTKNVKPENFFKIFFVFAEDFRERLLQLQELEKKRNETEEIAIKKDNLDRRKADLANRRNVNALANSSIQKRFYNQSSPSMIQIAKQQKDEEVLTQLNNMVSELVNGRPKGKSISISSVENK